MRLVVELEEKAMGIRTRISLRDLGPDGDEAVLEHRVVHALLVPVERVAIQLPVVMQVEDELEVASERLIDREVDALEE